MINAPGTRHSIVSEAGCIVLAIYEKPVKFRGGRRYRCAAVNLCGQREIQVREGSLPAGVETRKSTSLPLQSANLADTQSEK